MKKIIKISLIILSIISVITLFIVFSEWMFLLLIISCFCYIVYDCIKDSNLKKKVKYITIITLVIAVYALLIYLTIKYLTFRTIIKYILFGFLALFVLSFIVGNIVGIKSKKAQEDIAIFFSFSRFLLIPLVPFLIIIITN